MTIFAIFLKCIANTDTPVEILAGPQMNSALISNVLEFRNQKGTRSKFISAGKSAFFKFNISIAQLLGETRSHILNDDTQYQTIGAGPSISADFQVLFNNPYGAASLTSLLEIQIYFRTIFTDPKLVGIS